MQRSILFDNSDLRKSDFMFLFFATFLIFKVDVAQANCTTVFESSESQIPSPSIVISNNNLLQMTIAELGSYDGHSFSEYALRKWSVEGRRVLGDIPLHDLEIGLRDSSEEILSHFVRNKKGPSRGPMSLLLEDLKAIDLTDSWQGSFYAGPETLRNIVKELGRLGVRVSYKGIGRAYIDWDGPSNLRQSSTPIKISSKRIDINAGLAKDLLGKRKLSSILKDFEPGYEDPRLISLRSSLQSRFEYHDIGKLTLTELCDKTESDVLRILEYSRRDLQMFQELLWNYGVRLRLAGEQLDWEY